MKYVRLNENIAIEIIPEEDPVFPGIHIHNRYSPEFVAQLMPVEDAVEVHEHWILVDGVFRAPEPEDPTTPIIPNQPTQAEKIATLQAKLQATTETQAFQEECLIEMAAIVYA